MTNFQAELKRIASIVPLAKVTQLETRRVRRKKVQNAAKTQKATNPQAS